MVDGSVPLLDERRVDTMIRGVADVKAEAIGTLRVLNMEFTGVLKVPGLGINLISEGVLHSHGCDIVSSAQEGWRRVIFKGRIIIEAKYEGGAFCVEAKKGAANACCSVCVGWGKQG
jgi:hypothetical protein